MASGRPSSLRGRPVITVIDAKPMDQVGFRDVSGTPSPVSPQPAAAPQHASTTEDPSESKLPPQRPKGPPSRPPPPSSKKHPAPSVPGRAAARPSSLHVEAVAPQPKPRARPRTVYSDVPSMEQGVADTQQPELAQPEPPVKKKPIGGVGVLTFTLPVPKPRSGDPSPSNYPSEDISGAAEQIVPPHPSGHSRAEDAVGASEINEPQSHVAGTPQDPEGLPAAPLEDKALIVTETEYAVPARKRPTIIRPGKQSLIAPVESNTQTDSNEREMSQPDNKLPPRPQGPAPKVPPLRPGALSTPSRPASLPPGSIKGHNEAPALPSTPPTTTPHEAPIPDHSNFAKPPGKPSANMPHDIIAPEKPEESLYPSLLAEHSHGQTDTHQENIYEDVSEVPKQNVPKGVRVLPFGPGGMEVKLRKTRQSPSPEPAESRDATSEISSIPQRPKIPPPVQNKQPTSVSHDFHDQVVHQTEQSVKETIPDENHSPQGRLYPKLPTPPPSPVSPSAAYSVASGTSSVLTSSKVQASAQEDPSRGISQPPANEPVISESKTGLYDFPKGLPEGSAEIAHSFSDAQDPGIQVNTNKKEAEGHARQDDISVSNSDVDVAPSVELHIDTGAVSYGHTVPERPVVPCVTETNADKPTAAAIAGGVRMLDISPDMLRKQLKSPKEKQLPSPGIQENSEPPAVAMKPVKLPPTIAKKPSSHEPPQHDVSGPDRSDTEEQKKPPPLLRPKPKPKPGAPPIAKKPVVSQARPQSVFANPNSAKEASQSSYVLSSVKRHSVGAPIKPELDDFHVPKIGQKPKPAVPAIKPPMMTANQQRPGARSNAIKMSIKPYLEGDNVRREKPVDEPLSVNIPTDQHQHQEACQTGQSQGSQPSPAGQSSPDSRLTSPDSQLSQDNQPSPRSKLSPSSHSSTNDQPSTALRPSVSPRSSGLYSVIKQQLSPDEESQETETANQTRKPASDNRSSLYSVIKSHVSPRVSPETSLDSTPEKNVSNTASGSVRPASPGSPNRPSQSAVRPASPDLLIPSRPAPAIPMSGPPKPAPRASTLPRMSQHTPNTPKTQDDSFEVLANVKHSNVTKSISEDNIAAINSELQEKAPAKAMRPGPTVVAPMKQASASKMEQTSTTDAKPARKKPVGGVGVLAFTMPQPKDEPEDVLSNTDTQQQYVYQSDTSQSNQGFVPASLAFEDINPVLPEDSGPQPEKKMPPPRPAAVVKDKPSEKTAPARPQPPRPQPPRPQPPKPAEGTKRSSPNKAAPPAKNQPSGKNLGKKSLPALPARPGPGHPLYHYVNQGGVDYSIADSISGPRAIARFDFEGESAGDLTFQEGEVIQLVRREGPDWYYGVIGSNSGVFPVVFVDIVEDLPPDVLSNSVGENCVVALFDYAGDKGDLSFQGGAVINVLAKLNDDWLKGEHNGVTGLFPAAYVDHVPPGLPFVESDERHKKQEEVEKVYGTVQYDFESSEPGDLPCKTGDRVLVLDWLGTDWVKGRLDTGMEGILPAAYLLLPINVAASPPVEQPVIPAAKLEQPKPRALAVHDYESGEPGDLVFTAGEEIELIKEINDDWFQGRVGQREGIFPKAFVKVIEPCPQAQC